MSPLTLKPMAGLTTRSTISDSDARGAKHTQRALADLERELGQHFEALAALLGMPRSYGAIYGVLYASPRSLSFTDIQEKLTLSKGSISQGLHALRDLGAIKPADGSDMRREHFVPEVELRKFVGAFLKESIQPELKIGTMRVESLRERFYAIISEKSNHSRILHSRLEKLHNWHRKANTLIPIISHILR